MSSVEKIQKLLQEAIVAFQQNRWTVAHNSALRILDKDLHHIDALHLLAQIAVHQRNWSRAEHYFSRAYTAYKAQSLLEQSTPAFWLGWAQVQIYQEQFDAAQRSCTRALAKNTNLEEACRYLGVIAQSQNHKDEALVYYEKALSIQPTFEVWLNLGVLRQQRHEYLQAVYALQQAVTLQPQQALAWRNLALAYQYLGQWPQAEEAVAEAMRCNPQDPVAISNRMFLLNYCPQYTPQYRLDQAVAAGARLAAIAQSIQPTIFKRWRCEPEPQRLRIGLLGGDFGDHPVGYFLSGPLRCLQEYPVDIILYDNFPLEDTWAQRLRSTVWRWQDVRRMNDAQLAQHIWNDAVQVLIDLSGHTAHNRLGVFAARPAPVQLTWLGYFATTGMPGIDYIVVDPYVAPPSSPQWFSEKAVYLPNTYRCFQVPEVEVTEGELAADALRAECGGGEKDGWITLGCFNNFSKINGTVFSLWLDILQLNDRLRLFLKAPQLSSSELQNQLQTQLSQRQLNPQRLILEGASDRTRYLQSWRQVDIALDPFPYTGGTVSIEALWMGVPVLTLKGNDLLSRSGENLLHNLGLQDWIAVDVEQYKEKAVRFSLDLAMLRQLHCTLRQRLLNSPLCDASNFAKAWQELMWGLWRLHS